MDGLRLAAAVKDRWPPIKIIIASGKAVPRKDKMPRDSQFLPKPYAPATVLAAVRQFQKFNRATWHRRSDRLSQEQVHVRRYQGGDNA
jgi:hypothetical protein